MPLDITRRDFLGGTALAIAAGLTPLDAEVSTFNGMVVARLRSDWKPAGRTFKTGSLIAADLDRFLAGGRDFDVIFEPTSRVSLQAYAVTRGFLLLDAIGRKEEVKVEDADIEAALEERGQQEGRKAMAVRAQLEKRKELGQFTEQVRFNKIRDYLLAKAQIKYVHFNYW